MTEDNQIIIEKINKMKVDVQENFKEWSLEIETCSAGLCIRYAKFPREAFDSSNWILVSSNTVKFWKTETGAKRYILNKMQFFTGLTQ